MRVAILYRLRKMRKDVVETNGLTDKRENVYLVSLFENVKKIYF